MIKSIPFKPGHLDLLDLADVHKDDPAIIEEYNNSLANATYLETIVDTETKRVLGLMNGILIHKNCFEVCMVVGKEAMEKPIAFSKHVKNAFDLYFSELECIRAQTLIRSGFPHLVQWMKVLGFEYECTLKKWGVQGDDYQVYVRFRDGI